MEGIDEPGEHMESAGREGLQWWKKEKKKKRKKKEEGWIEMGERLENIISGVTSLITVTGQFLFGLLV